VSLSPRSGRNERSEWRTARRAVDWRGGAAPFNLGAGTSLSLFQRRAVSFQVYLTRFRLQGTGAFKISPNQGVSFMPIGYALHYIRYLLATLSTVAFKIGAN